MSQSPSSPAARPGVLEALVLLTIVAACSQIGYVGHPRYGPFIAVADVLCALVFLGWAFQQVILRRRAPASFPWPPMALWAWIAVGVLSLAKPVLDAEGTLSLGGLKAGVIELAQIGLYFIAGYMLFTETFDTPAKRRRCVTVLLLAVSLVVLWGLKDYATVHVATAAWERAHADESTAGDQSAKPSPMDVKAGFGNRNVYSAFLVMVIPLLVGFTLHDASIWRRVWGHAVCGVGIVTMLGPPHAWVLLGVLVWMLLRRGSQTARYVAPALTVFTLLVVAVLPLNRAANITELSDIYERGELFKLELAQEQADAPADLIVKKRWIEWQPALLMITENLPLGVGAGSFQRSIGEAQYYGDVPNVKKAEPDTNNLYLVVGASMGFAGLVCLLALLGTFWRWARALPTGDAQERGLSAGLYGAMLGMMCANIFSSLFVRGCSLVWVLVFALIAACMATRGQAAEAGMEHTQQETTR